MEQEQAPQNPPTTDARLNGSRKTATTSNLTLLARELKALEVTAATGPTIFPARHLSAATAANHRVIYQSVAEAGFLRRGRIP